MAGSSPCTEHDFVYGWFKHETRDPKDAKALLNEQ
jgi:hypothetical protein